MAANIRPYYPTEEILNTSSFFIEGPEGVLVKLQEQRLSTFMSQNDGCNGVTRGIRLKWICPARICIVIEVTA